METLGPEPRMNPESEESSQALQDFSKADGKEFAGTLDGEGNGGSWRVGCNLSSYRFNWGKGDHLRYLLASLAL